MQDQQVVQTRLPHIPHESLADGIGSWGINRRFEQLDATGPRHPHKRGSKLALVISYQILRCLSIGRGFAELLGRPGIGRRSCHTHLDDLACSTSALVEALCERSSGTSGWFACTHEGPVSTILPESFQHAKANCPWPSD